MSETSWSEIVSDAADRTDFYLDGVEAEIEAVRQGGNEPDDSLVSDLAFYLVIKKIVGAYREDHDLSFDLVQVHESGQYAEVVIRRNDGEVVYAGNIPKQSNPSAYRPPHP